MNKGFIQRQFREVLKHKIGAGFTLIELIVVIAIIAILSGIVLFSINQYISKGKDSNIYGNLAILVPAGEAFYNGGNSYEGFCNIENGAIKNAISQMPENPNGACYNSKMPTAGNVSVGNPAGLCCTENNPLYQAWAACATQLSNPDKYYCVDSRGVKKEVDGTCGIGITQCP